MRNPHHGQRPPILGCAAHGMTRRRFLGTCGACAGAAGLAATPTWLKAAFPAAEAKAEAKLRIRVLYALHAPVQDRPDWPNIGFDFRPVIEGFNTELARRFPATTFLPTLSDGPVAPA